MDAIEGLKVNWARETDLTIEEVKATKGMAHFTDEQAKEVIEVIQAYCRIVYALHKKEVDEEIDFEGKVVSLSEFEVPTKAAV